MLAQYILSEPEKMAFRTAGINVNKPTTISILSFPLQSQTAIQVIRNPALFHSYNNSDDDNDDDNPITTKPTHKVKQKRTSVSTRC